MDLSLGEQQATPSRLQRRFPVVEVFGPTIQGEGIDQGIPCYFVRFGGCDYKCEWCDTPYAVLPEAVRRAEKLSTNEIVDRIYRLAPGPNWIILSGGNPLLHDLEDVVTALRQEGFRISVETQGTRWKPWIRRCDRIALSPKPPSSGHRQDISTFVDFVLGSSRNEPPLGQAFIKIVVFDRGDYEFARTVHSALRRVPMFLSAGNDAGATVGNPSRKDERTHSQVVTDLCYSGRKLANWVMVDSLMADVRVQVQNHVLYWGNDRGR